MHVILSELGTNLVIFKALIMIQRQCRICGLTVGHPGANCVIISGIHGFERSNLLTLLKGLVRSKMAQITAFGAWKSRVARLN